MSSSPSTYWPLPSIPPLISPFLPGEPPSSRAAPNTASSSICGPSRPTWSSRTGTTCFGPSPPPPYGHLEQRGIPSRTRPTRDKDPKPRKITANPQFRIAGARRQVLRDVAPLATGAQNVHDAVDHLAHVDAPFAAAALGQGGLS